MNSKQQITYAYAMSLLGLPYSWGGNNPLRGFDCSGFIYELACMIGFSPPLRMNAQELYNYYLFHGAPSDPKFGALCFYGKSLNEISHIGFCLSSSLMIEAASGDHTTIDLATAVRQGACVKIRPIKYRTDFLSVVMPNWPNWNE